MKRVSSSSQKHPVPARREFLVRAASLATAAASVPVTAGAARPAPALRATEAMSLDGEWLFRTDPQDGGTRESWFATDAARANWLEIRVPHTWQVEPSLAAYRGVAWYRRGFDAPERWAGSVVRVEFEAVYHTATVWVNGRRAGDHARRGYTAFTLDISRFLHPGSPNSLVVRVDNSFDEHMLPRGRSSDFPHDGGIFRPVQLLVTPETFVEQVHVEASPDLASGDAELAILTQCRNASAEPWKGRASFRVVDEETGREVLSNPHAGHLVIQSAAVQTLAITAKLPGARLWHFDHPHLYRLELLITDGREAHSFATAFGVRKFEVKDGSFYLNGERVRLMGVERMAGSNPEFGMAEPESWITHDHDDLKQLNCVFTRVHWPQDTRVLDYCDRHGILVQSEIPAWGWDTFKGMRDEPDADILENGFEQMREMIARDRNHPCVVIWGLCNEVGGQHPPAYQFAKRLLAEVRKLDPNRLCSYASNSLEKNPERDVAGLMDIIEMNEYVGTWSPGNLDSLHRYLDGAHSAFPGKPIVISEYGYCACVPERPEDDSRRIETLRSHDGVFRSKEFVAGAIFFCYNDYRSQAGFSGVAALQQNVHGVVDVFGRRKPSFEALREECSPVLALSVENHGNSFRVLVRTRNDLPAYVLRGYLVRGIFYGEGEIPLEQRAEELPAIAPGGEARVELSFSAAKPASRISFDVLRPNGVSARSLDWKL
jgi:beta-galactosidase